MCYRCRLQPRQNPDLIAPSVPLSVLLSYLQVLCCCDSPSSNSASLLWAQSRGVFIDRNSRGSDSHASCVVVRTSCWRRKANILHMLGAVTVTVRVSVIAQIPVQSNAIKITIPLVPNLSQHLDRNREIARGLGRLQSLEHQQRKRRPLEISGQVKVFLTFRCWKSQTTNWKDVHLPEKFDVSLEAGKTWFRSKYIR